MDIFLLEDDEAIGIGLTYSLENEGYKVTLAKNITGKSPFALTFLQISYPLPSGKVKSRI